jgi:hypothetical protein
MRRFSMIMMGRNYYYDDSSYWTLGEYAMHHITESSKKNGAGYEIENELMYLSISECANLDT